ncbi:hypothetical protein BGX28_006249 [Mortierella sp. GBA30]|nr:hypothetical protein BGX28_006249 [Mortierella sp. GBA30]
MFAIDCVPLNLLTSKQFGEFLHDLDPTFVLPSLPKFNEMLGDINVSKIAGRSWHYSKGKGDVKYVGVTFHFVRLCDFTLQSVVIGMEPVDESQTAEVLKRVINEVLDRWELGGKVLGCTTDQASNIKRVMSELNSNSGIKWRACASHTSHKLHLCVNYALSNTESFKSIFDKCAALSKTFRNVDHAARVLQKAQLELDADKRPVKPKVFTVPDPLELKPASDATQSLSADRQSTILREYAEVHQMINSADELVTPEAKEFRDMLQVQMTERWDFDDVKDEELFVTFLNPAFAAHEMFQHPCPDGRKTSTVTTLAS